MAYRHGNYDFVIDSSFTPFTMQEMLVPFAAYKEAYEKDEAAYIDLRKQADKFKYLSETLPENSEAKQLYEEYANRLNTAAQDFSTHGRGMSNMRDLFNLKADYEGTIGMLDKADTNLQKELELRRQMSAKDPSILWSTPTESLNIDSYLYGKRPNDFGISGDALYAAGAQAAQAASKRKFIYNDQETTLGGYFYDIVKKLGYGPEAVAKFRSDMESIPELKAQYDNIVKSYNLENNLTGDSRGAADTQIIRGMIDGMLYSEEHSQQRDYDMLTASEQKSLDLQRENMNRQAAASGLFWDENSKSYKYDITKDPSKAPDLWMYDIDPKTGQIKGYSNAYINAVKKGVVSGGKPTTPKNNNRKAKPNVFIGTDGQVKQITTKDGKLLGTYITYADAVSKYPAISKYVGEDNDLYDYFETNTGVNIIANGSNSSQNTNVTGSNMQLGE